jgi:aspyridone synthetase trans-acting enoyl reductase
VLQVGNKVRKVLVVGDRVCGSVLGNNPDDPDNGAFSEYVTVAGDLLIKIPSSMSYQTAATLGIGMATVGLALYQSLNLQLPGTERSQDSEPRFVLVYGGGTATGGLALQMARMYESTFPYVSA